MRFPEDDLLPPQEKDALISKGRELCKGHELEIPLQPKEKLQAFVLGYLAGSIYTDRDVSPHDMGMVFMPLMFGALQPSEECLKVLQTNLPDVGPEPKEPEPVAEPPLPKEPKEPRVLKPISPNPEKVRKIKSAIEWVEARQEDLDLYLAKVERLNRIRDGKNVERFARLQTKTQEWQETCARLKSIFEENTRNADPIFAAWEAEHALWKQKSARNEAVRKGFYLQYTANLGFVWEHVSKAGPTSVNGYPIFFSLKIMHKEDSVRVAAAIERERKRQREIEI